MHSKVFKKVMLAVPLDYLTRGQYVMSNASGRSKRARELRGLRGTAITLRMRAVCTDKTVLTSLPRSCFSVVTKRSFPTTTLKRLGGRLEHHCLFRSLHYSTSRLPYQNCLFYPDQLSSLII